MKNTFRYRKMTFGGEGIETGKRAWYIEIKEIRKKREGGPMQIDDTWWDDFWELLEKLFGKKNG